MARSFQGGAGWGIGSWAGWHGTDPLFRLSSGCRIKPVDILFDPILKSHAGLVLEGIPCLDDLSLGERLVKSVWVWDILGHILKAHGLVKCPDHLMEG